MGHKIFVSYKYADDQVANLPGQWNSTVRNYVDKLEDYFDSSSHIYKGESSGEDLSQLEEETIWAKLRDRIFDSTMTIVFISPGMKVSWMKEKDQWIPWEISFSLRTSKRKTQNGGTYTSNPNAMLAVVLPDTNGSYDYFHWNRNCCTSGCTSILKDNAFTIIGQNMFNYKPAKTDTCKNGLTNWHGEASYIGCVRWNDFIKNTESYIDASYKRQKDIDDYDIHVNLT
jgi:hypothetical protein